MVFFQNLIRGILRKRRLRMTILLILYNFNEYLIYFFLYSQFIFKYFRFKTYHQIKVLYLHQVSQSIIMTGLHQFLFKCRLYEP